MLEMNEPINNTGDKGPNTHWVHGKNIEIAVNIWLQYAHDQMLSTFQIYPVMWPRYAQWVHAEYILNVPSHLTPMYPVGKQLGTFLIFTKIWLQYAQ